MFAINMHFKVFLINSFENSESFLFFSFIHKFCRMNLSKKKNFSKYILK